MFVGAAVFNQDIEYLNTGAVISFGDVSWMFQEVTEYNQHLTKLCFFSSDPEQYLNEESEVFHYKNISMTRSPEELW
jgi:hypothetical protein